MVAFSKQKAQIVHRHQLGDYVFRREYEGALFMGSSGEQRGFGSGRERGFARSKCDRTIRAK